MSTGDGHLRGHDWEKLTAQLTTFVWRRMGARKDKWADAKDIAQEVIAKAFKNRGGWDPEKEPLRKYLCRVAFGVISNERARARNSFEIAIADVPETEGEVDVVDQTTEEPIEDVVDRRRMAEIFRQRLLRRVAGDEIKAAVLDFLMRGIDVPAEQEKESGYTLAQLGDARRRLYYDAEVISKELARELDSDEED